LDVGWESHNARLYNFACIIGHYDLILDQNPPANERAISWEWISILECLQPNSARMFDSPSNAIANQINFCTQTTNEFSNDPLKPYLRPSTNVTS